MRVLGVIPARLGSTRLPNKPLQLLAGEPLITRVVERVREHRLTDDLVVATDSSRVVQVVERFGARAVLTHSTHLTGTDRVAEVAGQPEFAGFDTIVNIQGDEPFLSREALAGGADRILADVIEHTRRTPVLHVPHTRLLGDVLEVDGGPPADA